MEKVGGKSFGKISVRGADLWARMPFVVIYLQKASLKAVGLISRNKAMVVAGKDHLRCTNEWNTQEAERQQSKKELKEERGKMQMRNRTEIKNAKIADTVQAPVHKEVNSCCGENTYGTSTTPGMASQRRKLEERQGSIFFHLQGRKKRSTSDEEERRKSSPKG